MSEYETIKEELREIKSLLRKSLIKEEPKQKEWVSAAEACDMLHIKPTTLASYRHKHIIDYRGPRPYHYSTKSINSILHNHTVKKVI